MVGLFTKKPRPSSFEVEKADESSGYCDCCGNISRHVWGWVHYKDGACVACYWMHWAVGHLQEPGANLDLVLGKWGDGTSAVDRFSVALVHREQEDGTPALMAIDADHRLKDRRLAATAMARNEVIGTPLAAQVFAIVDAIYEQDGRFF